MMPAHTIHQMGLWIRAALSPMEMPILRPKVQMDTTGRRKDGIKAHIHRRDRRLMATTDNRNRACITSKDLQLGIWTTAEGPAPQKDAVRRCSLRWPVAAVLTFCFNTGLHIANTGLESTWVCIRMRRMDAAGAGKQKGMFQKRDSGPKALSGSALQRSTLSKVLQPPFVTVPQNALLKCEMMGVRGTFPQRGGYLRNCIPVTVLSIVSVFSPPYYRFTFTLII